ncbi:hypothetical protein C7D74_28890, partial [Klebsiella pneumoniae]
TRFTEISLHEPDKAAVWAFALQGTPVDAPRTAACGNEGRLKPGFPIPLSTMCSSPVSIRPSRWKSARTR